MATKPKLPKNVEMHGTHKITRIVSADADCFDEPLHGNPFVSGLLAKIALLPDEVIAATSALLRLGLRTDSVGLIVKEAVFEAERGLLDNNPDNYNKEVFF